jgi:hypothetical protein
MKAKFELTTETKTIFGRTLFEMMGDMNRAAAIIYSNDAPRPPNHTHPGSPWRRDSEAWLVYQHPEFFDLVPGITKDGDIYIGARKSSVTGPYAVTKDPDFFVMASDVENIRDYYATLHKYEPKKITAG